MTPSQKDGIARFWPQFGLDYQPTPIQLPDDFASVTLEIGIGNGDALIEMAAADLNNLYIGMDVHQPGIGRCLNRIDQQDLNNVRLIEHDAIEVLQQMLPVACCQRILLFFPDPWPKKRHHKRRIVNQVFRDLVDRCLQVNGLVHMATDWQEYAEVIAEEFRGDPRYRSQGDENGIVPRPDYRPETHFERRGQRLGHGVWDLVFVKTSDSSPPTSR